ncbi:MAG TPA: DNA polymerase I [Clostridia bacterium]|nr:DNA polymerase I [Clostridia bacterium]
MNKLIAIDGNSLMHRAYWALPSMMTKSGTPTGAIYGFVNMLLRLAATEPSNLLVAFDMHGPTFRHEQYADYKAGRRETPDDLRAQFPLIKHLLTEMKIKICEVERYEADDILGAYARIANERGIPALLVTGDRDALQLVSDMTHVLMTKKGVTDTVEYDKDALMEQYGLAPEQMRDLKALMGDGSDNIPGIPGVGEVTALKLLSKYGSMENALAHAEEEKGALREKLFSGAESARMSYRLGTIDTCAPVPENLDECRFDAANLALGVPFMRELELRSIIDRLPGKSAPAPAVPSTGKVAHALVDDEAKLAALVRDLETAPSLAVHVDSAFSASADGEKQADCVLGATLLECGLDEGRIYKAFKPLFEDAGKGKLFFDSKRLRHAALRNGVSIQNVAFDAMLADYLLHAIHPADSLKTLAGERLKTEDAGAAALVRLYPVMRAEMEEKDLSRLYDEVELPLVEVLFDMEREGFALDRAELQALSLRFHARSDELAREIYALAGGEFNILSTKQLGAVLFEKLELPVMKKTKTGYSTDSEVLESLFDMHPVVPLILEYRTLTKLSSTFVDGLLALIRPETGRVHTSFNQNVASTGRISSTEPNLQNIPVRTDIGRDIRRAFVASEGCVLVDADYSQIELRLLAAMSGDRGMIDAFLDGADIHRRTASEVFGVAFAQVSAAQRSAAKAVNFGIVYGISDFGLSRQLGISRKEAARYIELYFARYPGVQAFLKQCVEDAKREGCAKTLMGRRREMPELSSSNYNTRAFGERVAMNMPIQGTAADIIKLAMVRVHRALKEDGFRAKLILQIHDELIIDCPFDEAERVERLLISCMENVLDLAVPLRADVKTGHSWYDTK